MFGPQRLFADLREIGHVVLEIEAGAEQFAVIPEFVVPCGRFVARIIDLGLQATNDFPRTVASAIHVRADPQLFDYADTQPKVRNITKSALGPAWRYWSHNFNWKEERTARRLLSQINGIFAHA